MALFHLPSGYLVVSEGTGAKLVDAASERSVELTPEEVLLLARASTGGLDPADAALRPLFEKLTKVGILDASAKLPKGSRTSVPALDPSAPKATELVKQLRRDLKVKRREGTSLAEVTDPVNGRTFVLYDFEVSLANMANGRRSYGDIVEAGRRLGIPVNHTSLVQFVKQLERYGFFVAPSAGGPPPRTTSKELAAEASSRAQFEEGARLLHEGRYVEAAAALQAHLGKQPNDAEAKRLLEDAVRSLTGAPATPPPAPEPAVTLTQVLFGEGAGSLQGAFGEPGEATSPAQPAWTEPPKPAGAKFLELEPDLGMLDLPGPAAKPSAEADFSDLDASSEVTETGIPMQPPPAPPPPPALQLEPPPSVTVALEPQPELHRPEPTMPLDLADTSAEPTAAERRTPEPELAGPMPAARRRSLVLPWIGSVLVSAGVGSLVTLQVVKDREPAVAAVVPPAHTPEHEPAAKVEPKPAEPTPPPPVEAKPANPEPTREPAKPAEPPPAVAEPVKTEEPKAEPAKTEPAKPARETEGWVAPAKIVRRGRVKMGDVKAPLAGTVEWDVQPLDRVKKGQKVGTLTAGRKQVKLVAPAAGLFAPAEGTEVAKGAPAASVIYFEAYVQALFDGAPKIGKTCRVRDAAGGDDAPCSVNQVSRRGAQTFVILTYEPLPLDQAEGLEVRFE